VGSAKCVNAQSDGSHKKKAISMPAPFPAALRWRIVWAYYLDGLSHAEIARSPLRVCEKTSRDVVALFDETGEVEPRSSSFAPKALNDDDCTAIIRMLVERPHNTLREHFRSFCRERGHRAHI